MQAWVWLAIAPWTLALFSHDPADAPSSRQLLAEDREQRGGSEVELRPLDPSVRQRYLLAVSAFRPSGAEVDFEYLVKDVRGRLAYTVAIERANVLYAGHTEPQQQILRATMLVRFEQGAWKIIHRHADTMVDLQLPTP